jgi:nickel/cobalt exporter
MASDEKTKLRTLLNYWVEHNREHSQEVRDWAAKARALGKGKVAEKMLQASREMDKASELLTESLKKLEEG